MSSKLIQFVSQLNNSYYLKGISKNTIYLYAELKANKAPTNNERIPLNISLVVDRSGSMSGKKLEYVKKAVHFVINNLNSEDYLSIVQYDNQVDVVSQSAKVSNKTILNQKVDAIQARGMTNLSGGMLEGYTQVQSTQQEQGFVNRVLLLSDGLANQGVTDTDKLQQIAQKKFRNDGIGLSTFGVGADFNELLMTGLSEYGGANYYYIDSPEKIPEIFAQELEGLLSVVAQSTFLTIKLPQELVKCKKVYGYPSEIKGNEVVVRFNDVFSEEEKGILLELELQKELVNNLTFDLQLQYDDVVNSLERINEQSSLSLQITDSATQFNGGINAKADENVALFIANDRYELAMQLADKREFKKVKTILEQAVSFLKPYLEKYPNSTQLKIQYKQIEDYLNRLGEIQQMERGAYAAFQKGSRSMNYMSKRKKV